MASDKNTPSVDESNGRSTPLRQDFDFGSTSDTEGVGSVVGGSYKLGKSKSKAPTVGNDGRPPVFTNISIGRG